MAAPARGNGLNLCEKCFAMLAAGAEFCPDCGAPVAAAGPTEGSDSEIYPQLAQANLLRMRGEYKQAEDVCLALLHRYPNNATANTLLGDIAAERGDLEYAVQWYELALDLVPDSEVDHQKLRSVRQRIEERDAAQTAQQLELPDRTPLGPRVIAAVAAIVIGVGIISFVLGRQAPAKPERSSPFVLKSEEPRDEADSTPPVQEPAPDTPVESPGSTTGSSSASTGSVAGSAWRPQEDAELTAMLTEKLTDKAALLDASVDPRSNGLRLTFQADESVSERELGARMASQAMEALPQTTVVVLRGIRSNRRFYVATVTKEAFDKTREAAWQETNKGNDKALADALITEEWRAGS